ncbi:MAG: hypothetical protein WCJ22_03785 [Actinomycetes bacterium]
MSALRVPITGTNGIECPRCTTLLFVDTGQAETMCSCGFTGSTVYLLEADYLRAGLPGWQARLEELDAAIAAGKRPPAGYVPMNKVLDVRRRQIPISPELAEPARRSGPAAYEVFWPSGLSS